MGTGAMIASSVEPPAFAAALNNRDPNLNGPDAVLVRLRPGVSVAAGRANLQAIANAADKTLAADPNTGGDIVSVLGVQRPAQIVNYHTMGTTPTILAVALAAGAIMALGLALGASVRRRRRDLAVLKTLGFTHRQLASAVASQATADAAVGIVFGIPLGVALGRELWTLFARNINAVPDPTVPVLVVGLVAFATLVFANVIALVPGRSAARTSTALALHAE
jgi:ABC-type antimicrobial peptide transport system permease subunit